LFTTTFEINWICNCVKHKDGYPIKTPKPDFYNNLDENKRISLTVKDFKTSCDRLLDLYPLYIETLKVFAIHKVFVEGEPSADLYSDNLLQDWKLELVKVNDKVQNLIDTIKQRSGSLQFP
jgi:hypothetical protein